MKKVILLLFLYAPLTLRAQQETDSIHTTQRLEEVVVEGARVVNTVKGQNVYPSTAQLQHATDGYSLLSKLNLPDIRVNQAEQTISAQGNIGVVQVRINDIPATRQDLASLDMGSISHVEYIRNPGVRYGADVAIVINIIVRRATHGYVVGTNLTQRLTSMKGNYHVYARWNKEKSEWTIDHTLVHSSLRGYNGQVTTRYLMEDASVYTKQSGTDQALSKDISNDIRLRHTLADSGRYVLQTTLTASMANSPANRSTDHLLAQGVESATYKDTHNRQAYPSLDLYCQIQTGQHQTLTLNTTGTYANSKYSYSFSELDALYHYVAHGTSYSLTGEAVYENRLRPFTLSVGTSYLLKYVANTYTGDIGTTTREHLSNVYAFTQIAGHLASLRYQLGMGASRQYYRQGTHHYIQWMVRPQLMLSYPAGRFNVRYNVNFSQAPSKIARASDIAIRTDEMTIDAGNPDLKTTKRIEQTLNISYQTPRLYAHVEAMHRANHHPNMQEIIRENNTFIFTQSNQKDINMLVGNAFVRYELIPDKLSWQLNGTLVRCFNYGYLYTHHYTSYNYSSSVNAYLGSFTIEAAADNGFSFLEGEHQGHMGASSSLSVTYQKRNLSLSLTVGNPLHSNPVVNRSKLLNRYVTQTFEARNRDLGRLVSLGVVWRLSRGRAYQDIRRKANGRQQETDIFTVTR